MKLLRQRSFLLGLLSGFSIAVMCVGWLQSPHTVAADAVTTDAGNAALNEIKQLRELLPDQAHAMADVSYHFGNLWFAASEANWPLAQFYLNETRSHLRWAVRIKPVRPLNGGASLDLQPVLQSMEDGALKTLQQAIETHDKSGFEGAYATTVEACVNCHTSSEKAFLRPAIPHSRSEFVLDFTPPADAPK